MHQLPVSTWATVAKNGVWIPTGMRIASVTTDATMTVTTVTTAMIGTTVTIATIGTGTGTVIPMAGTGIGVTEGRLPVAARACEEGCRA